MPTCRTTHSHLYLCSIPDCPRKPACQSTYPQFLTKTVISRRNSVLDNLLSKPIPELPFTKTAQEITLERGVLFASLQQEGGDWNQTSFPLENFIGIEDGMFWIADQTSVQALITSIGKFVLAVGPEGGFVASAKDLEIIVKPDQTLLRAMLPDGKGEFGAASFDLDPVLDNRDGDFDWIGWD
jgi:hypothetical protein